MLYDFVDEYKKIKVGGKIKVKSECLPPGMKGFIIVPKDFQKYVKKYSNKFTVRAIQEIDEGNAMIAVFEVQGVLEYSQLEPFSYRGTVKVINC